MTSRLLHHQHHLFRTGVLMIGLTAASPVDAQTFPLSPADQPALAIQLEKPLLPDADGLATYSSIVEADGVFPLSSGASLQIGIPLAVAGADGVSGTSAYVGNLRASLLFGGPDALTSFVGVTIPTAANIAGPDLAVVVGVLPWLDEREKWIDDVFSLRGGVLPSRTLDGGGRIGLRLGGSALVRTNFENLIAYARAGGWGRFPVGRAELRADLGTSYEVTGDDGFGQQFTSYLALGAALSGASGMPGLFLRIPLDGDARQLLDVSVGLSARF